jgi:hypothetical protein
MNKLKDTRIFGDLIVDDSITKNNKEVATEEYVDTKLSAKQDKLTLNSGQVLGGASSGTGEVEAIDTVNINSLGLAKDTDIPTKVSDLANDTGFTTNKGTVTQVKAGTTQVSGLTLSVSNGTTTPTITTSINNAANFRSAIGAGTVTQVKVGSTSYTPASGVISLPAYPTPTTYSGSTSIKLSSNSFQRAALTGDVTSPQNSNTTTIANNAVTTDKINNNAVTLAKIQKIATGKVLGRTSSGTGEVEAIDTINIDEINQSNWTEVWSGSINLNSYRSSYYTTPVPSGSYIGKRIAIEIQYGTGTTYTSKIIFGVLGSSSATTASTSIGRGIGWSYFDGTYLRVKTLYAYTPTSNTSTIYVGHLKTLFGTFTGTTIEWSTSYSETLYMKKIWVIE